MAPHRVRRVLVRHFIKELAWSDWNKRKKTGIAVLVGLEFCVIGSGVFQEMWVADFAWRLKVKGA